MWAPGGPELGTITAMSREERYLVVTNDLNAHVQVTLLTQDIPNLSESQRQNQIILAQDDHRFFLSPCTARLPAGFKQQVPCT